MKTYSGQFVAQFVVSLPFSFTAKNRNQAKSFLLALMKGDTITDEDDVEHTLPTITPGATPNSLHAVGVQEDHGIEPFMTEDLSVPALEDWQAQENQRNAVAAELLSWVDADPDNMQELVDVVISQKTPEEAEAFVNQLKLPGNMAEQ